MQLYKKHRTAVLAAASALAVLVLVAVIAIVAQANAPKTPVIKPPRPPAHWLVTTDAISQLRDAGASTTLIAKSFGHSSYVIDTSSPVGYGIRTATYDSYAAIVQAFASGALPGNYQAVIYNNEDAPGTPTAEQRDPAKYEQLTGSLLHKRGLLYIATPAVDLVSVLNHGAPSSRALTLYLSDHIAADAAKYAGIVVIQGQRDEARPGEYAAFVKAAAAQARAANSSVIVLAGLKSGPSVTSAQLSAAYRSVSSAVNGYWLTITVPSTHCPSCNSTDTRSALGLLRDIYR
jgi:hypothetical protein